jgi:hypothetical protein
VSARQAQAGQERRDSRRQAGAGGVVERREGSDEARVNALAARDGDESVVRRARNALGFFLGWAPGVD